MLPPHCSGRDSANSVGGRRIVIENSTEFLLTYKVLKGSNSTPLINLRGKIVKYNIAQLSKFE